MTQLGEAVARFHKLIESDPFKNLEWAFALRDRMIAGNLTSAGRPICPFLRPHFISRRRYAALVKASEALLSAMDRIKQMALANPALLNRMELLPAEKMLASIDPGYPFLTVTSLLDAHLNSGPLRFVNYDADTAPGVAFGAALDELFFNCPPVKQFRRQYKLSRVGGTKHLVSSVLQAYKLYGGKQKPRVGVLEFRQAFQASEASEYLLLCELFRKEGCVAEIVSPDQIEYRNGVLRQGDFVIDLVFRRVKVQEFLLRFDLSHPLVRAYQDRAVCVVNSFRSELAHKRAIFDLLTDETITSGFPAAERRAIRDHVPWTRMVSESKAKYQGRTVDLTDFILKNREKLVLKPNDETSEEHAYQGWLLDNLGWERALRLALRRPYVVQERVEPVREVFPVLFYGELQMREVDVDVHPLAFLGKVQGCASWLSEPVSGGFSSIAGLAPTFILEGNN